MKRFFIIACILIIVTGFACKDSPQPCLTCPPSPERISIDTLLVDPTEAWLKLRVLTDELPGTILRLTRNDETIFTHTISSRFDTTLHDINLLPHQHYQYRASLCYGLFTATSRILDVTTMDTTSHNFTWQIDTLGEVGQSMLSDVAIISDTSVWVVGEMYVPDSTGQPIKYNAAHWNGRRWNLIRVFFPVCDFNGTEVGTAIFSCRAVFGFGESDIWFTSGGDFVHWNGSGFQRMCLRSGIIAGEILKLWGTSDQNLYGVGRTGTVIHYDGQSWQKQESGTDVDLLDVWGTPDGTQVWACGYYRDRIGNYLFKYTQGSGWVMAYDGTSSRFVIRNDSLSGAFASVFLLNSQRLFVASPSGLYETPVDTRGEAKRLSFTNSFFPGFPRAVRGNGINDLTVAGDFTMIAHYNGYGWHYFNELRTSDTQFNAMAQKGDLVVAVGLIQDPLNSRAVVYRGYRR